MDLTVVERIIGAIADVEETNPEHLDISLENWIETDAIRLLAEQEKNSWELAFKVGNHDVMVAGDETIFINGEQRRTSN